MCGQPNSQLCSFHPDVQLHLVTCGTPYPTLIIRGQYLRIIPGVCLACTCDNHDLLHTHYHYNPAPYTPSCCWALQVYISLPSTYTLPHTLLPPVTTTSTTTIHDPSPIHDSQTGNRNNDEEELTAKLTATTQRGPMPSYSLPGKNNNTSSSKTLVPYMLVLIIILTVTTVIHYCASTTQTTQHPTNNNPTTISTAKNRHIKTVRANKHLILLLAMAITTNRIEGVKIKGTPSWFRQCTCNACEIHWFRNGWICRVTFRAQAHHSAR